MKTRKLKKTEAIDKEGRLWDKESIQALILEKDQAVYHALLRIYDRQTEDEKIHEETRDWNARGFTGVDAEILSSFVKNYKKYGKLTPKQMAIARNKMKKYWKQLLEVIRNENSFQPERIEVNDNN